MKKSLYLKNIGKLSEAEIDLEGITVICGENNTGKSTIGKSLYNIYNVFVDCEKFIGNQRNNEIKNEFLKLQNDIDLIFKPEINPEVIFGRDELNEKYVSLFIKCSKDEIEKTADDYFREYVRLNKIEMPLNENDEHRYQNWKKRAIKAFSDVLEVTDKEIICDYLTIRTEEVFHRQATRISAEESFTELKDEAKGSLAARFISGDKCTDIQRDYSVTASDVPVYIESPHIIDYLNNSFFNTEEFVRKLLSPSLNLRELFAHITAENIVSGIRPAASNRIDIIKTEKKIKEMISELNSLLNGTFESDKGSVKFKDKNITESLDVRNLSTGIKSMAVIERCLSLGLIKEESTLILDEPEIHLHPEWQLKYAEFIVILQKALDLTVLITTHSPQFLRALEVYTDKYDIMDRLNVYSVEGDNIRNASYSEYGVSGIYEKLSAPYEELQQMLYEKYGEDYE